jgi:seryl-tRNA synthetase
MLQVAHIRENKEAYIAALQKRKFNAEKHFDEILTLDEKRRSTQTELDVILAKSNGLSKEIGNLYKSGEQEKAGQLKEETAGLKEESKALNEKLQDLSHKLQVLLYNVPNIPHDSVPFGDSDEENKELYRKGERPELGKNALPHWELAKKYDLIDFELGNKITGAGFPVYKGKGARLQRALAAYFLDKNVAAGYTEYQVPLVVNEASGLGTGQLPDKEGQMYHIKEDDLYLIPTSEVPLTNLFRDEILKEGDLPLRCTAHTNNFRREAGSYGKHVRGLNRLHQFEKVELVNVVKPENSYQVLDEMVEHIEGILQELKLPYRVLRLCGGDLGFTAALTIDFEVFSTAQDRWLEISSVSNFEEYQANRLKTRYKTKDKKKHLVHTLNGSSLALPRLLAGILENYQTKGGIEMPEVLKNYLPFDRID